MWVRFADLLGPRQSYVVSELAAAAIQRGLIHEVGYTPRDDQPTGRAAHLHTWIAEHCRGDYTLHRDLRRPARSYVFRFSDPVDAMAFKMRWC